MMGNFGFDARRDAERVAEGTRIVERSSRGGKPGRRRYPIISGSPGIRTARTPSGGIAAKSGTTSGSATCTFYDSNGASQPLGTETATVYNDFPAAFDGNRVIKVHWEGGAWRVLVQSCS
jgi:hypothetical protein